MSITLSIITITLSNDAELANTLRSLELLKKSELSFKIQHIIVSPDVTCEQLSDCEFYYKKRSGIYPAMNVGIEAAKGDYLWFLNAGDECIEDLPVSNILDRDDDNPHVVCAPVIRKYSDRSQSLYKGRITNPHQGIFYSRKVFELVGLYDERYQVISDCLLFDRIRKFKVKRYFLHDPVAYFDMSGVSSSREGQLKNRLEFRHHLTTNWFSVVAWYRFFRSSIF